MITRLAEARVVAWALLAASVIAHVVVTAIGAGPFRMVDLKVYVEGAEHLTDGTLYLFTSAPFDLPFTYPPFSAVLFTPFAWMPWVLARVIWQVASLAALAGMIHLTLVLLGRAGRRAAAPLAGARQVVVLGTAACLWIEPVRTTFNYGQINLFLAVLLLWGAVSARGWIAGGTVGVAAGIKLVPAITGLYYLVQRRWNAVAAAVVAFGITVGIGALIVPTETREFFTRYMLDPARTGPIWSAINQSMRGALARFTHDDPVAAWVVACVLVLVLGVACTLVALRAADRTGAFLAVQLIGLLVSPISWSHHWVWVVPILLWCLFGRYAGRGEVRVLAVLWVAATFSYLVSILIGAGDQEVAARPLWQSVLGVAYPLLGIATLVVILTANRASRVLPAASNVRS